MVDVKWEWNNVDEIGNEDMRYYLTSDIGEYRICKETIGKYDEDGNETVGLYGTLSVHTISAVDNGLMMCKKIRELFEAGCYENIDMWTETTYNSCISNLYAVCADTYTSSDDLDDMFNDVVNLFKDAETKEMTMAV